MKKIEFFSRIPGLAESFPIVPAKEFMPNWASTARTDYIDSLKQNSGRFSHIYQCPGIFDLMSQGFIIPMWHDVLIETNGDPKNFGWTIPTTDIVDLMDGMNLVEKQQSGLDGLLPTRPWGLQTIIKFNTPWQIIAPKGMKFIMIPLPYPDGYEFECTQGILDPGISSEINFQIWWNITKGKYMLKAGTPMCQLIPLTEDKYSFECRDMTANDELWVKKRKFLNGCTFKIKRNLVKDLYYKHFGKK